MKIKRRARVAGIQFTTPGVGGSAVPLIREAMARGEVFRAHAFECAWAKADIDRFDPQQFRILGADANYMIEPTESALSIMLSV